MASPCVHPHRSSRGPVAHLVAASLFVLICASAVSAQEPEPEYDAPPHISLLDGEVEIVRDGRRDPAAIGHIFESGDRVDVRSGRAEVLFGDGSALHLDTGTTLDVLDDGLLRLLGGRVYLHVADTRGAFEYRLDTPAASVYTETSGEYRLVVDDRGTPTLELAVARGLASATTPQDSVAVRAGEMLRIRAGDRPGRPVGFNVAYWDDFGRWSQERRHGRVDAYARDLPAPLGPYAPAFAQYGHWDRHATYGPVWYPRVSSGWRPFYHGRWTSIAPYGWTWVGGDPWSWPTHHYGSWGVTAVGGWFWIPGSRWRPAPVHWTVTSAHVGWVPWGYGSVGAFGFTLIPRTVFAVNVFVPRHVVHVHTVRPVVHNVFVAHPPPLPHATRAGHAFTVTRRPIPQRVAVPRYGSVPSANVDRRPIAPGVAANDRSGAPGPERPARAALGRAPLPTAPTPGTAEGAGFSPGRRAVPRAPERAVNTANSDVGAVPADPIAQGRPVDGLRVDERRGNYRMAIPRGGDDGSRTLAVSPSAPPPPAPRPAPPRVIDPGGERTGGDSGFRRPTERAVSGDAPRSAPQPAERGGSRMAVPRGDGNGERRSAGDGGDRGGGRRRP